MNRNSGFTLVVLVVLIAGVLIAGCTDSSPANNPVAQTPEITTAPSTTALYSAGDIVRSSKSAAETGWLILKYDSGLDSYERAFIYRNNDGNWGYRVDSRTETLDRSVLEKVNTVKVTQIDLSSVSLSKPTVSMSTVTAGATSSGTTATSTPVTSNTLAMQPQIKGITPESGNAGSSVSITDIMGNAFQSGASVVLIRSDSPNITATNVNVQSSTHMSCTFPLPVNATVGIWDLVVINKDGQSARYSNAFTVRTNPSVTATTTSSLTGGITITSIDPTSAYAGYVPVTIYGSNFKNGITGKLTRNGYADIPGSDPWRTSETQMQCFFAIPTGSTGSWNLVLTNTDGTSGTFSGFMVNS